MPKTTAEAVLLEILRQSDGEWVGKTRLFKAFYFAHLYYGQRRPGLLTDSSFARMPQGPGIDNATTLFKVMVGKGLLTIDRVKGDGPYSEYRYRLTKEGNAAPGVPEEAARAVEESVSFCKDKTASQLSQVTHDNSRSWIEGGNGDILNIDVDMIPDDEYEMRASTLKDIRKTAGNIFDVE